ncbi:MAG: hypothetical protein MHM6MM_004659 [Cercozoa sp. M6MM]
MRLLPPPPIDAKFLDPLTTRSAILRPERASLWDQTQDNAQHDLSLTCLVMAEAMRPRAGVARTAADDALLNASTIEEESKPLPANLFMQRAQTRKRSVKTAPSLKMARSDASTEQSRRAQKKVRALVRRAAASFCPVVGFALVPRPESDSVEPVVLQGSTYI